MEIGFCPIEVLSTKYRGCRFVLFPVHLALIIPCALPALDTLLMPLAATHFIYLARLVKLLGFSGLSRAEGMRVQNG